MSFSAYYDALTAGSAQEPVSVGDLTFNPQGPLDSSVRTAYLRLHANYPTVGEYWAAIGFEPEKVTPSDVKAAVQTAYEFQNGTGGFDERAYSSGAAAAAGANSGAAAGLNLVDAAPDAFNSKECGALMAKIIVQLVDPAQGARCAATCQNFWQSINKCKELLSTAKVIVDELAKSEVAKERFTFLKYNAVPAKLAVNSAMLVAKMAPAINKLAGFFSWAYHGVGNAINRIRGKSTAPASTDAAAPEEADSSSGRDSQDSPEAVREAKDRAASEAARPEAVHPDGGAVHGR